MGSLERFAAGAIVLCAAATAAAADLTIHLAGNPAFTRSVHRFQCDAKGPALGLPAGPFTVEYINGGGNSLAIVPVGGSSVIFASVNSGSGARYAAGANVWWDAAGRGVSFSSDTLGGQTTSTCHRLPAN